MFRFVTVINPITKKEDTALRNFIPETTVMTKYSKDDDLEAKLGNASIYIIREEQVKKLYAKVNTQVGKNYSHRQLTLADFIRSGIGSFRRVI